jgi:hypothetical protein
MKRLNTNLLVICQFWVRGCRKSCLTVTGKPRVRLRFSLSSVLHLLYVSVKEKVRLLFTFLQLLCYSENVCCRLTARLTVLNCR